jgi:hypothetical protein
MEYINIQQALATTPASRSRWIALSAIRLINAGIFANDSHACAVEAKRVYKRQARGMWKKIQADAKKVLRAAEKHNLTIDRPYFITHYQYGSMLNTLSSDGVMPMCNVGRRSL